VKANGTVELTTSLACAVLATSAASPKAMANRESTIENIRILIACSFFPSPGRLWDTKLRIGHGE